MKLIRKVLVLGILLGCLGVLSNFTSVQAKSDPLQECLDQCDAFYYVCVIDSGSDPRRLRACGWQYNKCRNLCHQF